MDAFSAHADRDDLLEFVERCRGRLRNTFLVHGEEAQSEAFGSRLTDRGVPNVHIPLLGEFVRLN
jgi:metallo-beta-lactamase family protein